jgi:anti-anti-sigma factor
MTNLFEIESQPGATIIRCTVPPPAGFENREAWRRAFGEAVLACSTPLLVVNMVNVSMLDNLSLAMLASTHAQLKQRGFAIRLCCLSPETRWALAAAQLIDLLNVFDTEPEALAMNALDR